MFMSSNSTLKSLTVERKIPTSKIGYQNQPASIFEFRSYGGVRLAPGRSCLAQAALPGFRFREPRTQITAWPVSCLAGIEPNMPQKIILKLRLLPKAICSSLPPEVMQKHLMSLARVPY